MEAGRERVSVVDMEKFDDKGSGKKDHDVESQRSNVADDARSTRSNAVPADPEAKNDTTSIETIEFRNGHLDIAAKFLYEHQDVDTSHVNITKMRHKIDRNIVTAMALCFIMQFMDKAIYNYSAVMGLKQDLGFRGNDFSNVASAYAVAHLLMQIPNAYLIQRLPASKWLSACVFGWGIVTICTAFVHNVTGMFITRVFLAICEATISPSLMLITSQWYTKSEQAPRFAIWHCAPGIGQIFGGLLSFAFQAIPRDGRWLTGWRLMFITLGIVTLFVAGITFRYLPDTPMEARFLSTEEKVALLKHVSVNMTGIVNHKARPREVLEGIKDIQIWGLVLPGIMASMSSGLTGTYSTTLIHQQGYSDKQTALLNMPTGVVSVICNLIVGWGIRKTSNRWLWGVGLTIPGIIGASVISFVKQPSLVGTLLGIYLVPTIYSIVTVVQTWAVANVAGHTKRAYTAAMMSACHGIGSIIAPQTFQARDKAGGYLPAKISVLGTQIACAIIFILLWRYYKWENHRRDKIQHQHVDALEDDKTGTHVQVSTEDSWGGLTDKQNLRFRYIY